MQIKRIEALADVEEEDAKMMKATITSKAMPSSTTSGIPLTPTAARITPFSSDMKPITWVTALRRVIMTRRPSSTTASANASVSRVKSMPDPVTESTSRIDRQTRKTPAISDSPMPRAVSIVPWICRRTTIRRSAIGIRMALITKARPAEA